MTDSTCAAAPFDHPRADIILRSSDNVDFRIFKLFLSLASPVFEALFEIPQPENPSEDQEIKDGLFVVPLAENSKILDILLRFCYPCTLADDPELDILKDAADVLEAAKKYSLDTIEKKARQAIASPKILEARPLQCFAIACQGRMHEETILSAKYTLNQPLIPTWFQEIQLLTSSDLLALLTYHKRCGDAVYALRADPSWITSHYGGYEACGWLLGRYRTTDYYGNTDYGTCGCQKSSIPYRLFEHEPAQWWEKFMDEAFMELRDKPCKATIEAVTEKAVQTVKALNCPACSPAITEGMRGFSELLVRKVDETVSQIELELNF